MCRLQEGTGQTLAYTSYNVEELPGDGFEERVVDAIELPDTNPLAFLVGGFGLRATSGLQQRSRLAVVNRHTLLTLSTANQAPAGWLAGYVPAAGELDALPDGGAALFATFGFVSLEVLRIDASTGSVLWSTARPALRPSRARISVGPGGRTALVQADVPVFGQITSQSCVAYDTQNGRVLFDCNGLGAGLPPGTTGAVTVGALAWIDPQVLVTGRGPGVFAYAAVLRGLQLGSLCDGAKLHSFAAGGQVPHVLIRGSSRAGNVYLLADRATGTAPGLPLDLVVAPLAFDNYTPVSPVSPASLAERLELYWLGCAQPRLRICLHAFGPAPAAAGTGSIDPNSRLVPTAAVPRVGTSLGPGSGPSARKPLRFRPLPSQAPGGRARKQIRCPERWLSADPSEPTSSNRSHSR